MKSALTSAICFFLPSTLIRVLLRILGHTIGENVKIGFSFINCNNILMEDEAKIGHFNLILNDNLKMHKNASIGYLNILKGPFDCILRTRASLGNKNYITRGKKGVTYGYSKLELGELTKITVGHHIDLTRSVIFGEFSIMAGIRSQVWTHGYYHANTGQKRIRIDGDVTVGKNVYIGSGCIFNPGVSIGDAVHLGSGCVISKDLMKPGMYVSQGLRLIENNLEIVQSKLKEVQIEGLVETVYTKN